MPEKIVIALDDIDEERLRRFSSIKNVSEDEAAKMLIHEKLREWLEGIDEVGMGDW